MSYNEQQASTPPQPSDPPVSATTSISSSYPAYLCLDPIYTRSYDGPSTSLSNEYNLSSQFVVPKQYFYFNAIKLLDKQYGETSEYFKNIQKLLGDAEGENFYNNLKNNFIKEMAKDIYEDTKHKVAGVYVDNFYKFISLKLTGNTKVIPPSVRGFISNNVSDEIIRSKNIEKVWASLQADTFTDINDALLKYNIINATNDDSFTPSTDIFNKAMTLTTELGDRGQPIYKYPSNPNASPIRNMFDFYDQVQTKVYNSLGTRDSFTKKHQNELNQFTFDTCFMNSINCFTPITPDIPLPLKPGKNNPNDLTPTPEHNKINELSIFNNYNKETQKVTGGSFNNMVSQTTSFLK